MSSPPRWRCAGAIVLLVAVTSCSSAAPSSSRPADAQATARPKSLTIGVTSRAQAMGVFAGTSTGGWSTLIELHTVGLITSDFSAPRPIGRMAEAVPSLDDGSIVVLPDGRMQVTYHLRRDATWQDGAPFTAHDLVFSRAFLNDPGLPIVRSDSARIMDSVEALDDWTAAITFTRPHFLGNLLGPREFWPQPRHLLAEAYERYTASGNADDVLSLPYWTSAYVNLGPFRVVDFDPGEGVTFQAYDGYFLGRPRLDTIYLRAFADENTLFANLLAGAVDLFPNPALHADLGFQLRDQWARNGGGTVYTLLGTTSFLSPQWRPSIQKEPANLDPRVRQALYQAIDRESFPEDAEPAWSLLPPGDPMYEPTRDGFRRFPYDPDRSRAILQEAGWTPGSDGALRNNADGRRFQNRISTVASGRLWEVATYADAWRRLGIDVEEAQIPPAQSRDLEFRALYPSWEATSAGQGDSILSRLNGPAASPENRWAGNRGGYDEPASQALVARYFSSLTPAAQVAGMRDISELVATELPMLIFYYSRQPIGVRSGVRALDDVAGGQDSSRPFGTYSRNAHLWELQS